MCTTATRTPDGRQDGSVNAPFVRRSQGRGLSVPLPFSLTSGDNGPFTYIFVRVFAFVFVFILALVPSPPRGGSALVSRALLPPLFGLPSRFVAFVLVVLRLEPRSFVRSASYLE
ncbi:hypothetical protein C8Q70DRAFT_189483 [Cubamyces menziesii]|nr:hypothetical protein C8Q70DRAFT_189483 [Cubamyces menziesii]